MKAKKWMALALTGAMLLALAGCGGGPVVYVQSVSGLMGMNGIAPGDRFAGVVVSEHVAEIQKDGDKTVEELLVKEGDDVTEGQALFSYDTEQLQLNLDKQRLELEQMQASIESYKDQIKQLEKERNRVGGSDKLQYTVQIQTTQVDLKETELKVATKEAEVQKSEDLLANATVVSPVTGRVQAVNEGNATDQMGNPKPYITIQKSGAYRVKGTLGELQRGAITQGSRIRILSRTDETQSWAGTVALVDFENPIQGNNNGMMMDMGGKDEMTAASKYPFYVELDSTEGLLLGQHVYLELDTGEGDSFAVAVPGQFLVMAEDGSSYVWAEKSGKLVKQAVELGEYNPMMNTYEILSGLTVEDSIAFPDESICHEGAATTHNLEEAQQSTEGGEMGEMGDMNDMGSMDAMDDMGIMDDMGDMDVMDDVPMDDVPMEDLGELPAEEQPADGEPLEEQPAETAEGGV